MIVANAYAIVWNQNNNTASQARLFLFSIEDKIKGKIW